MQSSGTESHVVGELGGLGSLPVEDPSLLWLKCSENTLVAQADKFSVASSWVSTLLGECRVECNAELTTIVLLITGLISLSSPHSEQTAKQDGSMVKFQ